MDNRVKELYDNLRSLGEQTIAGEVEKARSETEILNTVKRWCVFLIGGHLMTVEFFENFEPSILEYLNIYTKGFNNIRAKDDCFTALVLDCYLDVDVHANCAAGIYVFGKGHVTANLYAESVSLVKAHHRSIIEIMADSGAVANIKFQGNSNLLLKPRSGSMVVIQNLSEGEFKCTNNNQVIHRI